MPAMESNRERKDYTITLDDDPLVHKIIQKTTGMASLPFVSSARLLERSASYQPMAVFFDVHLGPNECGIDIIPACRETWPYSAFFVVTADDDDRLIGQALASGANDFIRKPINHNELVARFRARLNEMRERQNRENIRFGEMILNIRQGLLHLNEQKIWLPPLEARLLQLLIESRGNLVSRDLVKRQLWGEVTVAENTLDQKISILRRSLAELKQDRIQVKTVYKKGFILVEEGGQQKAARAS
jgi:DNA-binding response OmpR family regulator